MHDLTTSDADTTSRRSPVLAASGSRRSLLRTPADRERAFRQARRRSWRVRFLRRAILACALGSVAAMVLIAVYNPFSTKLGSLGFSGVSLDGTKIAMEKPRLSGFRSDGQSYTLTAVKAIQDVTHPTTVELQQVSGEIGRTGGELTHLSADTGIYDSAADHMTLSRNVHIGGDHFQVRLRSADIDFKTGVYQSDEPVEVHVGEGTTITGDRATARHNGEEFDFEGHVRTVIIPPATGANDEAKGASQ
jgi:lipopolysaccharide export system protein LptC